MIEMFDTSASSSSPDSVPMLLHYLAKYNTKQDKHPRQKELLTSATDEHTPESGNITVTTNNKTKFQSTDRS